MNKATRWIQRLFTIDILLIAICLSIFVFPGGVLAGKFTVVRVYDGDRFKAVGHDIEIKVRLAGIDSPETKKKKRAAGQPFCQSA